MIGKVIPLFGTRGSVAARMDMYCGALLFVPCLPHVGLKSATLLLSSQTLS